MVENNSSNTKTPFAIGIANEFIIYGDGADGKKNSLSAYSSFVSDILNNKNETEYFATFRNENFQFNTAELLVLFLQHVTQFCHKFLKVKVTKAVFAIPSSYGLPQMLALSSASSFLNIESKFVSQNEAALYYFVNRNKVKGLHMIINIGHSFTQCSLFSVGANIQTVAQRSLLIGGVNFEFALKKLLRTTEYNSADLVKLKEKLSANKDLVVNIAGESVKLARVDFEDIIKDYVTEIVNLVQVVGAELLPELESIQLIGGSSYIPVIKQNLVDRYGNKLETKINGDEAVAMGVLLMPKDRMRIIDNEIAFLKAEVTYNDKTVEFDGNRFEIDFESAVESCEVVFSKRTELVKFTVTSECSMTRMEFSLNKLLMGEAEGKCGDESIKLKLDRKTFFSSVDDIGKVTKLKKLEESLEKIAKVRNDFEQFIFGLKRDLEHNREVAA